MMTPRRNSPKPTRGGGVTEELVAIVISDERRRIYTEMDQSLDSVRGDFE